MNAQQFWNIENVCTFRGFNIRNGEVELTESEYVDYLNEVYGDVMVCCQEFGQGDLLQDADPCAFRCGKGDYEGELQSELEDQLNKEDSDDIEFIDGDELELYDEEEEESQYKTVTLAWGIYSFGVIDAKDGRMHAWAETEEQAIEDLYRTTSIFPGSYIVAVKIGDSEYTPCSNSFKPE